MLRGFSECQISLGESYQHRSVLCSRALYLCFLWKLEGVYAISEVGGERVVQLAQRLLQRLEHLFVFSQCLQLLLEADLPVHCLDEDTDTETHI